MRLKLSLLALLFMLISGLQAHATTYTVKPGGGGNYTTIQACATAMAAGDTCAVYAGTYNEVVTLSAGAGGSYKTLSVNASDTVNVYGFVMASHTRITGFTITNPSSPASNACVSIPTGTTDAYVTSNTMTSCGNGAYMISSPNSSTGSNHIYIQNNTMTWGCDTPAALNSCKGVMIMGDHWLVENNDFSHSADFATLMGNHSVLRGNKMHDITTADCGSHSSNCHIDFIESEPEVPSTPPSAFNLYEGNTQLNNIGPNAHGFLTQGDACGGECSHTIERFNLVAHEGSASGNSYVVLDDLGGYTYVKLYNNTWAFIGVNKDTTDTFNDNSINGGVKNSIYYYNGSITNNPYAYVGSSGTGFSSGNNLAYCTGSCSFFGAAYGSGTWTSVPGNIQADPQFVNSAADNYALAAGSPAISAGSYLTTASGSGSNSTALTVADAAWFYDGAGGLVSPDWIRIGPSTTVQIASIDYSTNVITLASPVNWSSGAGVYLYKDSRGNVVLNGANPDIGDSPINGTQTPAPPPPTSGVAPPTNLQAIVN